MNYAIFGAAGAVGKELVPVLLGERGATVRVVGRKEQELRRAFQKWESQVEYCVADLSSPSDALRAASGIDTVFYLVGVPYHQFDLHPVISQSCVRAAAKAGVKQFVHLSTLYSYGRMQGNCITESHPRDPHTYKGEMRKRQEDIVLGSHGSSGLRVTILCAPDFYGGDSPLSLVYGIFEGAVHGTAANAIGPVDKPHEFVYVPDLARTLYQLSREENAYGQRWNLGGVGLISIREFANLVYRKVGKEPKLRIAGKFILRLLGLRNVLMREFVEMHYLISDPLVVDDSKLRKLIPELTKTSYEEGIGRTMDLLRRKNPEPSMF